MNATETTTYNGWTNYETWAVNLWMDNERGSQSYWAEIALECYNEAEGNQYTAREDQARYDLAARLKDEHEASLPDMDGFAADLLNAAMSEVNWYEIAANLLEEVDKSLDEEIEAE